MSTDQSFVDFVIDQIDFDGEITAKKMFGEYGIYANNKIFGLICDNQLFIKPTKAGKAFIKTPIEAPPYPGVKMYFLITEQLENREWLSKLIEISYNELPEPKPKRKKKK